MHLGMAECHIPFPRHCDLDLWPSLNNHCVWRISLILFEIRIPCLVCGCILGWWSALYHLCVNVILTSDLVFRLIVSGAYLECWFLLGWWSGAYHFWSLWPLTLTSGLFLEHISYNTTNFPQICHMPICIHIGTPLLLILTCQCHLLITFANIVIGAFLIATYLVWSCSVTSLQGSDFLLVYRVCPPSWGKYL